ncbi:hypothetical protein DSO57_1000765 [Entomophthora muscae]|uniref:Uncharacterized protein n=1 Tax=Entomophthora muscae TaxID=34485 RepID=A0ACC2T917_9FUNG|nr:hypothetical protein DSO57_1000765 [Entomophthora muscae]
MIALLWLFAPILENLASVMIKEAVNSLATSWPTLYMLTPPNSYYDLPSKIILALTIFISIFCYTSPGACRRADARHPLPPSCHPPQASRPPRLALAGLPPASHPLAHPSPSGPAACPQATRPLPGPLPTASCPPGSQGPLPSQPKPTMTPSQSEKSLETRDNFKNNSCAQEEGQIHVSKTRQNSKNIEEKLKLTSEDKNNMTYSQWNQVDGNNQLGLDSNQTSIPKPKIEVFEPKSCHHRLTTHPEETIGPKQNCLKPQQIAQEQGFGHPFKHQFPIPMTKLLGTPVPCFFSHLQNFASGGPL